MSGRLQRGRRWLGVRRYRHDLMLGPLGPAARLRVLGRRAHNLLSRPGAPDSLEIGATYRCQAACGHCGVAGQQRDDLAELSDRELMDVIAGARALGASLVVFGGGEPLLRPGLPGLLERTTAAGMMAALSTNGLLLDRAMAARLRRARVSYVNVSIDSAEGPRHDRSRGVPGCFEAATAAVRGCAEAGVSAIVSTCFDQQSIRDRDLERIISLARDLGARGVRLLPEAAAGRRQGCPRWVLSPQELRYIRGLLDPGFVYVEGICNELMECNAALRRLFYVSPYGHVQPCSFVPLYFGTVRERPLAAIWGEMRRHPFYRRVSSSECIMRQAGDLDHGLAGASRDGSAELPRRI
jgi:MoaA/NifB/PqqE/SkfB family radical SAM enzyme